VIGVGFKFAALGAVSEAIAVTQGWNDDVAILVIW
jgi:hypothetical protein